jgi:hypothetical protein
MQKGRMIGKMEIHGEELRDLIRDHLLSHHPALRSYATKNQKIWIEVENRPPTLDNCNGFKDWNLIVEVFEAVE